MNKLNSMITSEEVYKTAMKIMNEYQDAVSVIMSATVQADVRELTRRSDPTTVKDIEQFASDITEKRMSKHGSQFFNDELERIMDAYNDNIYDLLEFNLRCEILASLKDSLINFKFK